MRVLLDTHLLLWSAEESSLLSASAREWIEDTANELFFSVASIWEIAVKHAQGRPDFVNRLTSSGQDCLQMATEKSSFEVTT